MLKSFRHILYQVLVVIPLFMTACSGADSGMDVDNGGNNNGNNGGIEMLTLRITVTGGSSVEYYGFQNVRLVCGGGGRSGEPNTCQAEIPKGNSVDLQKTLDLSDVENARWRLAGWGGDCLGIDPLTQVRGGHCRFTMDGDKNVLVNFDQRALTRVENISTDPLNFNILVDRSPQTNFGNPFDFHGLFSCNYPSGPYCVFEMMYDVGTLVTLTVGPGDFPLGWKNWGGQCAQAGSNTVCVITVSGDTNITANWSRN